MKRRRFLVASAGAALATAGCANWLWRREGWLSACETDPGVASAFDLEERVRGVFEDLDTGPVWDAHVHLIGVGDGDGQGSWVNPRMQSLLHPSWWARYKTYVRASCIDPGATIDAGYIQRLARLHELLPIPCRLLLLAFDLRYDESGRVDRERSVFYIANDYAARIANEWPRRFAWACSVHPYREDCVEALQTAVQAGARAVKWLPPAMGIDPSSKRCDRFYERLASLGIPLLSHAGDEHAVPVPRRDQKLGNPLLLRRALEHGVRVIVAHCAVQGRGLDLDRRNGKTRLPNFELFARMMDEPRYEGQLFGELSCLTLRYHLGQGLETVLIRGDWHGRLCNGSDYPLPAIPLVHSLPAMKRKGFLASADLDLLYRLQNYNPLLFDQALKRSIRFRGKRLRAQALSGIGALGPVYEEPPERGQEDPAATGRESADMRDVRVRSP